jgi:hypothetical protein
MRSNEDYLKNPSLYIHRDYLDGDLKRQTNLCQINRRTLLDTFDKLSSNPETAFAAVFGSYGSHDLITAQSRIKDIIAACLKLAPNGNTPEKNGLLRTKNAVKQFNAAIERLGGSFVTLNGQPALSDVELKKLRLDYPAIEKSRSESFASETSRNKSAKDAIKKRGGSLDFELK